MTKWYCMQLEKQCGTVCLPANICTRTRTYKICEKNILLLRRGVARTLSYTYVPCFNFPLFFFPQGHLSTVCSLFHFVTWAEYTITRKLIFSTGPDGAVQQYVANALFLFMVFIELQHFTRENTTRNSTVGKKTSRQYNL